MNHAFLFDNSIPFEERALRIFSFQYALNPVFRRFCDVLDVNPENVTCPEDIPLLPVEAFRDAECTCWPGEQHDLTFRSSGTTGMRRSRHPVKDAGVYAESVKRGMSAFYNLDEYVLLACTPGYNDNPDSSLVWMLNHLINLDRTGLSRFLPVGQGPEQEPTAGKKLMLFGAAFGLIDMAEASPAALPAGSIIVETGGMKTHRREMGREEMHTKLATAFGLPPENIHSEYGMTELLSQAWMQGDGAFRCPHWMRVSVHDPDNPPERLPDGREGLIGITDLANLNSCSFLMTGDAGVRNPDGSFRVLGRMQPHNLRGCNFLVEED